MTQDERQSELRKQREAFVDLAVRYLEGMLAAEEVRRLESFLESDAKWRDLFVRVTVQSRLLAESVAKGLVNDEGASKPEITTADLLREVMDQQDAARARREAQALAERRRRETQEKLRQESYARLMGQSPIDDKPRTRHYVIPTPLFYGSIAALVALAALIVFPFLPDRGASVTTQPTSAATATYATIAEADNVMWTNEQLPTAPGGRLPAGALSLMRGTLHLTMDTGAEVFVAAPAAFDLRDGGLLYLQRGDVAAHVPKRATGFTILGPGVKVVDLGTEFGMHVSDGDRAEVHVFLGKVRAATLDAADSEKTPRVLKAAESVLMDGRSGAITTIDTASDRFEWALPHLALLNRNLVKNPGFEEDEPGLAWVDPEKKNQGRYDYVDDIRISHWQDEGRGTTIGYRQGARFDYIKPWRDRVPREEGKAYYVAFAHDAVITQRLEVSALSAAIDGDLIDYDFSAWLGGYLGQGEHLICRASFLGDDDEVIGQVMLDPVLVADRKAQSGFVFRQSRGRVPNKTRAISIDLQTKNAPAEPNVSDGYADNIALVLSVRDE